MKLLYLTSALASLGFLLCIQLLSKTRKSELLLPWYDVTSTGDGISPEVVNYWKVERRSISCDRQQILIPSLFDIAGSSKDGCPE